MWASRIDVLAGVNGAGKSSIAGVMYVAAGAEYFNPDEAALKIRAANRDLTVEEANSEAWHQGKRLLERAIAEGLSYAFESTLGGSTIPGLLQKAISSGIEVRIWYVGLSSPELHIARVQARVGRGGHDIPESKIRQRYNASPLNLIHLLPGLTGLRVYDNSNEADPHTGKAPTPELIIHMERGRIVGTCELLQAPEWAKPILAAALRHAGAPL